MKNEPKYPDIKVKLSERDGNAFMVLGLMYGALKEANLPAEELTAFTKEATKGNYDELLQTCMKWVTIE